jgi:5-methylcytosine-specific restriction protein A
MATKKSKVYSSKRKSSNRTYVNPTRHARQKMYGETPWKHYRRRFLFHNPKCYVCHSKATVIDHIVAHKGDRQLFEDVRNHMPLCAPCHNTITTKFDRDYKVGETIEPKAKWLERKRMEFNNDCSIRIIPNYKK